MGVVIEDWPTFLDAIRLRPAMYFGYTSLSRLESFLAGWDAAEKIYQIPEERRLKGFSWREFEAWAAERFNPRQLSINSFHMARLATATEEEAFRRWFEWYDEFQMTNAQ